MYRPLFILIISALISSACNTPSPKGVPGIPDPESESGAPSSSQSEAESQNTGQPADTSQQDVAGVEQEPPRPDDEQEDTSSSASMPETPAESESGAPSSSQQDVAGAPQETSQPSNEQDGGFAQARTDEEKVAVLDKRLEEELRNYDQQLHEELEKTAAEKRARSAQGEALEQDAEHETGEGEPAQGHEQTTRQDEHVVKIESQTSPSSTNQTTQDAEPAGRGRQIKGGKNNRPDDIPSGSDDDVVARQLREAAEKETDPELREKLWDEYRKYKKQQASVSTPPAQIGQ